MNNKEIEIFMRKLHRRNLVGWQEEMRLGRPLYDALLQRLAAGAISPHQTANALVVLYRLRGCGSDMEVFGQVVAALAHPTARVRNQAVGLAVGMMREHNWEPAYLNEAVRSALRESWAAGIDKDAERLVRALLEVGPDALKLK